MAKNEIESIILTLSPLEKKVMPLLHLGVERIKEQLALDETSVIRALRFLESKKLVELKVERKKVAELDINGILYRKSNLPERKLLNALVEKMKALSFEEAKKASGLTDNEFMIALGVLKGKNFVKVDSGKIRLVAATEIVPKIFPEEKFLSDLPMELESMDEEQKKIFEKLKLRKKIIRIEEKQKFDIELSKSGSEVLDELPKFKHELIEQVTSELIEKESWRGKRFRKYDITSRAPNIYGGKKHFVRQARDYAKNIWLEMGFEEMTGNLAQTSFWNFDALFTAQDHPVREMQDTFFIKDVKGRLPDKKLVAQVKKAHESGVKGSKGWQYGWDENEAKKVVLRTHTTCLSAQTLSKIAGLKDLKEKKGKFFAIGKCFRNETVDWSHGFEFNQTEGIVVDKNANFIHLIGYLREFYKKMGWEKVRFRPSYFPYTEPSMEIDVFVPEKDTWLELGGAGILRPEVVIPLLGEYIPVLAWGPGFDRMLMDYYQIKDLRELHENDLNKLRKIKFWMK